MRFTLAVLFAGLLAASAAAQPWYARGEFNGWTQDNPMTQDPMDSTHWTADITGLFDDQPYNWKIACCGGDGWAINMPSSDGRVYTDAAGDINFHLYDQTSWSDGWFPNNVRRVGYEDHQQFDWEIVGTFTDPDWSATHDPTYYLTDLGDGLHSGTFAMPAGIHEFKFRGVEAEVGDPWDVSIGANFGNLGAHLTTCSRLPTKVMNGRSSSTCRTVGFGILPRSRRSSKATTTAMAASMRPTTSGGARTTRVMRPVTILGEPILAGLAAAVRFPGSRAARVLATKR